MNTFTIDQLKRGDSSPRHFHAVKAGKYKVSIQASEGHYCTPKKTLRRPEDYVSFEVAIFGSNGNMITPNRSTVIKAFPNLNRCDISSGSKVIGWVPTDVVEELVNYLRDINNKNR